MFGLSGKEQVLAAGILFGALIILKLLRDIIQEMYLNQNLGGSWQELQKNPADETATPTPPGIPQDDDSPEKPLDKPKKNLTPEQELAEREKSLKEREKKLKSEKIRELEEREKKISQRQSKPEGGEDGDWFMKVIEGQSEEEQEQAILERLNDLEKKHGAKEISQNNYETMKKEYEEQIKKLRDNTGQNP